MRKGLPLRFHLMLLSILPVLTTGTMLAGLSIYQFVDLSDQKTRDIHEVMMMAKRNELKNYVELALNSARTLHENAASDGLEDRKKVASNLLSRFIFGQNDYVFVIDYDGVVVAHINPKLLGKTSVE